jgi:peptidoglycan/LPS O-acetylase OafA/YrhL
MFSFAILAGKRAGLAAIILWVGLIVIYNTADASPSFPGSFFLSAYNLEFLIGVVIAGLLRRTEFRFGRALATLGAVLFIALMLTRVERLIDNSAIALRLAFALCAAVFVIGTVEIERKHGASVPAWLSLLGAASYSIYLLHSLIEPVVMVAVWPYVKVLSPILITVGLVSVATACAVVFHKFIERPLMMRLRRASERPTVPPPI